jgi:peptidoglycan/LPS O-acetylase OafA/YrhL
MTAEPGAAPSRHLPALDGIRGLAIVWVVLHNSLADFAPATGPLHWVALLAHPGWIGVQLFFALSGFLITGGLLDTRGASNYFSGFYARRALRILPLYYGVLLATLVILPLIGGTPRVLQQAVVHQSSLWLFVVNWTQAPVYGFTHFWSLAVEEQFYLIWPLIVYCLSTRRLLIACLAIALAALAVRIGMVLGGATHAAIYMDTTCRMDALALGAAGACLIRIARVYNYVTQRLPAVAIATACAFLAGIPLTGVYNYSKIPCETYGYTLLAWCCAVFVTGVAITDGPMPSRVSALLRWRVLRSCGKYSYAMYVFHEMLHKLLVEPWISAHFGVHPRPYVVFLAGIIILLVSYGLAFASYYGLERRFLRLKGLVRPYGPIEQPARVT